MIYRQIPRIGIELSVIGLGGHEYLPDGQLRGFQEDFARAITPGQVFPGFGGEKRRRIVKLAYDRGINFYDATQDSEKEALGQLTGDAAAVRSLCADPSRADDVRS